MGLKIKDFVNQVMGHSFDEDGAYGAQCWDLFRYFLNLIGAGDYSCQCQITGYVPDIWELKDQYGYFDLFDYIAPENVKDGDWVIYPKGNAYAPYGHIAMVYQGQILGQNQHDHAYVDMDTFYPGILGGLRWKGWEPEPTAPTESIDDLANDVIAGKWGNGSDRVNNLTNAGYDANAVQARVNQVLGGGEPASQPLVDIEALANAVIAGQYGTGDDRRNALGDNYDAVQARVNELMAQSQPAADIDDLARRTIAGEFGNGDDRRAALGELYDQVQARVNEMM